MADDREKLLRIMNSLEADYRSGKISAEKYSYFRAKYEDKLNSIDAQAATKRIRSMQGKPSSTKGQNKRKNTKKSSYKKKSGQEDLVQKYIIDPKKDDAKYNKKERFSMDTGTFTLFLVLILVLGFTAGVAYGIFGCDFNSGGEVDSSIVVADTAFPEITSNIILNNTTTTYSSSYDDSSDSSDDDSDSSSISTTVDSSDSYSSSSSNSYSSDYQSSSSSSSESQSSQSGSSSSDSGSSSESGGGSQSEN